MMTAKNTTRESLRVNGRAVLNASGAKQAAASIGCVQTRGTQTGQGNVREMLEYIGTGEALVQMTSIDDPYRMREIADTIASLAHDDHDETAEMLRATAAALRNAAKLREETY